MTEKTPAVDSPIPTEPASSPPEEPSSPRWPWATKLIVGLILTIVALFLVVQFKDYLSLVITSFLLAFLFHPAARLLEKHLKLSWRISVAIIYLVMALVLGGLIAWGGISLYGQLQNLIAFFEENLGGITKILEEWSNRIVNIGPFHITIPELDTKYLSDLLVERIQPVLGEAGTLLGKVVSGGANLIFQFLVIYMVSFFIASESGGASNSLFNINLPGYEQDIKRMSKELSNIWNAFIRGEFVVVGTSIVIFSILLGALGMPYFLGLALIAGMGRFVPYVGAWFSWITFGLVAVFQNPTPLGLTPVAYMVVIIICSLIVDSLLDNVLTPKVMGNALQVHPAAILISALIGAQVLGLIGVVLAAPVFASIKLVAGYIVHKLMDQDPWEGITYYQRPKKPVLLKWFQKSWKKASIRTQKTWDKIFIWTKKARKNNTIWVQGQLRSTGATKNSLKTKKRAGKKK